MNILDRLVLLILMFNIIGGEEIFSDIFLTIFVVGYAVYSFAAEMAGGDDG